MVGYRRVFDKAVDPATIETRGKATRLDRTLDCNHKDHENGKFWPSSQMLNSRGS